ncbi:MAG: DUF6036 family nucleotidyltransferase [Stenotrophomonas sp.]
MAKLQSTPLLEAIRELFDREAARIEVPREPIKVYIAGGAAVHFWTRARVSTDVDAEFSTRYVPGEDIVLYRASNGEELPVYIDRQYNPMFALLHENYQVNAVPVGADLGGGRAFDIRVLAPVDLAISKLGRWAGHDQEDVMSLAVMGLVDPDELRARANEALATAVGLNPRMVAVNLAEAVAHVRRLHPAPSA